MARDAAPTLWHRGLEHQLIQADVRLQADEFVLVQLITATLGAVIGVLLTNFVLRIRLLWLPSACNRLRAFAPLVEGHG